MGGFGRSCARLGVVLLALGVLAPVASAGPPIYSYTDENGVIHFTSVKKDSRYSLAKGLNPTVHKRRYEAPKDWRYDGLIGVTARQHQVQPALVKAVIAAESNFDARAVSRKGAQGLMQLMPQTAARLGVKDPFQPTQNVSGGTRYLRLMLDRYGDMERALAAYNAGPTAVDRHGGIPPYRETRDYVARVLTYYRNYHGDFAR
jgi:soluble lytic murein transglycosylase